MGPQLDFINLEENSLKTIEVGWIEHLKSQAREGNVLLEGNPIVCDCGMKPLLEKKEDFEDMVDFEQIMCVSQSDYLHQGVSLATFRYRQLDCSEHIETDDGGLVERIEESVDGL